MQIPDNKIADVSSKTICEIFSGPDWVEDIVLFLDWVFESGTELELDELKNIIDYGNLDELKNLHNDIADVHPNMMVALIRYKQYIELLKRRN